MKVDLEVIILSVGEPQLHRCIDAIKNQDPPGFNSLIHIKNVVPHKKALDVSLLRVKAKWGLWVAGDVILFKNAASIIAEYMTSNPPRGNTCQYCFGLYDPFIEQEIAGCPLRRVSAFSHVPREDVLGNDMLSLRAMQARGWDIDRPNKKGIIIGTHFDDPDDFQVFRRFYARGIKAHRMPRQKVKFARILKSLMARHPDDSRYKKAYSAFELGLKTGNYPTSHNVEFDREMFYKWLISA